MNNFCELHLRVKLIDDLPERVGTVLDILVGDRTIEEDFVAPDHDFFKVDDWHMALRTYVMGSTLLVNSSRRDRYLTINSCYLLPDDFYEKNDMDDNLLHLFVDWVATYIHRPKERCCIGYYFFSADRFPVILEISTAGLGCVHLGRILDASAPVIVDPVEKSIIKAPDFTSGDLKSLLERVVGKVFECDGCGDCEEDNKKIPKDNLN